MIDRTLAHYEITDLLGKGGMGEVYRARDTKLGREVALKVLPREMSEDPERLARFEREARTLASLQHNHIASVYGFETVEEVRFLVMELVEGEDLSERLERGALAVEETIEIALQVAIGLQVAHERGIVHRDLKPANVKVTGDGQVKILDFGLARAMASPGDEEGDPATSPTVTAAMTQAGTILGSAAYMSPEQARGKTVDKRADIWAFGCLLYETLTGTRAFDGETISDTLAAVLRADLELDRLPSEIPQPLRWLLDRCLQRNPQRRLQDIGEAVILLEDIRSGEVEMGTETGGLPSARPAAKGARWGWIAGVVAALLLGATAATLLRPSDPEPPLRKLALDVQLESVTSPMVSPDGRHIAFLSGQDLWVRSLDQLYPRKVVDGVDPLFRPAWSPQSDAIVFVTGRTLSRVSLVGGSVTPVCDVGGVAGGAGGSWGADGRILFAIGQNHVYTVPAGGGVAEIHTAVVDSVDADIHQPHLLPNGESLLVVRHTNMSVPNVLSVVRDGEFTDLHIAPAGLYWDPVYDPRGYILVTRLGEGAGLWAFPFDPDAAELTGEPFMVVPEAGSPSVAADGTLVYQLGEQTISASIATVNRAGEVLKEWTEPEYGNFTFDISPDETGVVMELRGDAGDPDLWIYDLARGSRTRFAFGPGRQGSPAWSPDGRWIAYSFNARLWIKPADGSSAERYLGQGMAPVFSPDGTQLFYRLTSPTNDIWVRSLDDPSDSTLVIGGPGNEFDPALSPDGRYLLYSSDESGTQEVYLRQFPSGTGRWQVSADGGEIPQWSKNGEKIYYVRSPELMEVEVELDPQPRLGTPQSLFSLRAVDLQEWGIHVIRPLAQADHFFALKMAEADRSLGIVLVDNWTREFEESN